MAVKITGIISSIRSAWDEVNPLGIEAGFSMYDHLEARVQTLEQEIIGLQRQLSDAQAALSSHMPPALLAGNLREAP